MTLVVDASVLTAIHLQEPVSVAARAAMAGQDLVAPQLIIAEVGNALWRGCRMDRLSATDARQAMRGLPNHFLRLIALSDLADAALALALRRDHPVYDCFYVALALREGAPLVTADRRLAERFARDAEIRLLAA
jgi:predicted nucleic acid-binding protein